MAGEEPFACYQPTVPDRPRGKCCVIANFCAVTATQVQSVKQIYTKDGDVERIRDFFENVLHYEYMEFINSTKHKFMGALNTIKHHLNLKENKSIDRLFLFILSHGSERGISMCTEDGRDYEKVEGEFQFVSAELITSFFDHSNIPSLKNHPKCIFIQACRGSELTKIAVHEELGEYNNYFGNVAKMGPSTQLEGADDDDQGDTSSEQDDNEDCELPWTGTRDKLRPSSENILVCYSCLKGEGAFSTSKRAHFIGNIITVFEKYYREQHLLDMVVEVTRVFGSSSVPSYPYPLIFSHDSTYEAELSLGPDFPDEKFSIYANSQSKSVKGKVVKFPSSFKGIIGNEVKKITVKTDILHCTLKYKPNNAPVTPITLNVEINKLEEQFLSNPDFEIDNSKDSLLFHGQRTIGFGQVTVDNQKVMSIAHEVYRCPEDAKYEIVYGEPKAMKPANFIEGKSCRIWRRLNDEEDGRHLVAVGDGIVRLSIPQLDIHLYQLPIFESTLTKKFYLSEPPENATRQLALESEPGTNFSRGVVSSARSRNASGSNLVRSRNASGSNLARSRNASESDFARSRNASESDMLASGVDMVEIGQTLVSVASDMVGSAVEETDAMSSSVMSGVRDQLSRMSLQPEDDCESFCVSLAAGLRPIKQTNNKRYQKVKLKLQQVVVDNTPDD